MIDLNQCPACGGNGRVPAVTGAYCQHCGGYGRIEASEHAGIAAKVARPVALGFCASLLARAARAMPIPLRRRAIASVSEE